MKSFLLKEWSIDKNYAACFVARWEQATSGTNRVPKSIGIYSALQLRKRPMRVLLNSLSLNTPNSMTETTQRCSRSEVKAR